MRKILIAIAVAAVSSMALAATSAVRVEQGLLKGTVEDGLTVYRGIPFAAPPVGDLRWRAPQPAAKWEGVRHADKFAPQCVQSISLGDERGLPVSQRLDARQVGRAPRSRCWSGSTAAASPSAPPPRPTTAASTWPARAWCWSASPIASGRSAFSRIRS